MRLAPPLGIWLALSSAVGCDLVLGYADLEPTKQADAPERDEGEGGAPPSDDVTGTGGGGANAGGEGAAAGEGGEGGSGGAATSSADVIAWGEIQGATVAFRLPPPGQAATTLAVQSTASVSGMDYSPDATQIAVTGRAGVGGDGVVHLYPADGTGIPATLAEFGDINTRLPIFSPDGAWVAVKVEVGNDVWETWVVPTAGGVAKRVSPSSFDTHTYRWSLSSDHLGIAGHVNGLGTLVVSDMTNPSAAPSTIATGVWTVPPQWDDQDRIYFLTGPQIALTAVMADADGTDTQVVQATVMSNESGTSNVASIGISRDGTTLAFSANAPLSSVYEVFTTPTAGGTTMQVSALQQAAPAGGEIRAPLTTHNIVWSRDASSLVVIADYDVGGVANNTFSVTLLPTAPPAGGAALTIPISAFGFGKIDFAHGDSHIMVVGDLVGLGEQQLYAIDDLSTPGQGFVNLAVAGGGGSEVFGFVTGPAW